MSVKITVKKRLLLDGKMYDGEDTMPPDARRAFQEPTGSARKGAPKIGKGEIDLSFQATGRPGFTWHKSWALGAAPTGDQR